MTVQWWGTSEQRACVLEQCRRDRYQLEVVVEADGTSKRVRRRGMVVMVMRMGMAMGVWIVVMGWKKRRRRKDERWKFRPGWIPLRSVSGLADEPNRRVAKFPDCTDLGP